MNSSAEFVSALLLGDLDEGRLLLHQVFHDTGWRLVEAHSRKDAIDRLKRETIHVVITRSDSPCWNWKTVLHSLKRRVHPPQLIVTSHTADERLWSEVLSCGGYDALTEPFRRQENERGV